MEKARDVWQKNKKGVWQKETKKFGRQKQRCLADRNKELSAKKNKMFGAKKERSLADRDKMFGRKNLGDTIYVLQSTETQRKKGNTKEEGKHKRIRDIQRKGEQWLRHLPKAGSGRRAAKGGEGR